MALATAALLAQEQFCCRFCCFARIWTNLAEKCAETSDVSQIRTNFASYHTRFNPVTATVAGFWGVCKLSCGAPYKSFVEICKGPHIRGPKPFVLGMYVCTYLRMYVKLAPLALHSNSTAFVHNSQLAIVCYWRVFFNLQ